MTKPPWICPQCGLNPDDPEVPDACFLPAEVGPGSVSGNLVIHRADAFEHHSAGFIRHKESGDVFPGVHVGRYDTALEI